MSGTNAEEPKPPVILTFQMNFLVVISFRYCAIRFGVGVFINNIKMEKQIELYRSPDGIVLNVQLANDTVWLSQEQLTVLFERDQSVISRHLANVFKEGELVKESNMQKMHIPNSDKPIILYNLDVIISVDYRVKSLRGTESNCRNVEVSNCRVTIFYFPFSILFSRAHEHTNNEHTN